MPRKTKQPKPHNFSNWKEIVDSMNAPPLRGAITKTGLLTEIHDQISNLSDQLDTLSGLWSAAFGPYPVPPSAPVETVAPALAISPRISDLTERLNVLLADARNRLT